MHDAAFAPATGCPALSAERGQLLLQGAKRLQARSNFAKLCIDDPVHIAAIPTRLSEKSEQQPDIGDRHVERPAVPDECQSFQVPVAISAITIRFAFCVQKKAHALVVTNGLDVHARGAAKFPDPHEVILALDPVAAPGS